MTKSELIAVLSTAQPQLQPRDVELAVKELLEQMSAALSSGQRIEVRGFGSFSLHYRPPRTGRNPKTGAAVRVPDKYVPHFKPGKGCASGSTAARRIPTNRPAGAVEPGLSQVRGRNINGMADPMPFFSVRRPARPGGGR